MIKRMARPGWRFSLLAAAFGLAAAVTMPAAEAADFSLAWIHGKRGAYSDKRIREGIAGYLASHDLDWRIRDFDGGIAKSVARSVTDAAAKDPDAILISMGDLSAAADAVDAARDKHIPVFAIASGWVPGVLVNIAANDWAMSAEVSAYLVNLMRGKGGLLLFTMDTDLGGRRRGDVAQAVLQTVPDIQVLTTYDIDTAHLHDDTQRRTTDYAVRYGNKIDAIWTPNDDAAMAAATGLKATGLTAFVTGMDGSPAVLKAICSPSSLMVATVQQPFAEFGGKAAELIDRIAAGHDDPNKLIPARTIYIPATLFTQEDCAPPGP